MTRRYDEEVWQKFAKRMLQGWCAKYEPIAFRIPCPDDQLRRLLAMREGEAILDTLNKPVPFFGARLRRDVLQTEEGMREYKLDLMEFPEEYWDVWIQEMKDSLRKK